MQVEKALAARQPGRYAVLPGGIARFERKQRGPDGLSYETGVLRYEWREGALGRIEMVEQQTARVPKPLFTDVTGDTFGSIASFEEQLRAGIPHWRSRLDAASGISVYGQQGIAVADVDGDGIDEIYVCQPGGLPNRLYKREASGRWVDWTERSGLGLLDDTPQALFADFRNVGRQDAVILTPSRAELFLNDGSGRFRRVPDAFRFAMPPQGAFSGMAAADYDRDGRLDLYLCTYLYFQSEEQYRYPVPYHDARNGPPNYLFHNRLKPDGTGWFEDTTSAAGIAVNNNRYSFAAAWCDTDGNGWPDLYVANDFGRNCFYKNEGGKFREAAADLGIDDMAPGMSASWFDCDGDGRPELYVGNMWTPSGQRVVDDAAFGPLRRGLDRSNYAGHTGGNSLYRLRADGKYANVAAAERAQMGRWAWSCDGIDWDLDGVPEIFITCGMLTGDKEPDLMSFFWRQVVSHSPIDTAADANYENGWNAINQFIREGYSWNGREPNVFLRREGGRYTDFSGVSGLDAAADSRAFCVIDLDGDGIPDLVLKNRLGPQLMAFRNDSAGARQPLVIELKGTRSNRDAIGAKVELMAEKGTVTKWLTAGSGYLSQHSKSLFFSAEAAVAVRVTWPSGEVDQFDGLKPGMRHRLTEGGGVQSQRLKPQPHDRAASPVTGVNTRWEGGVRLLEPIPLPIAPAGRDRVILSEPMPEGDASVLAILRRYLLDDRSGMGLPALVLDARGAVIGLAPAADRQPLPQALPFQGVYLDPPARSYFRLAMPFVAAGYPDAARPYLEQALKQEPENFKLQLAAGQIALESGRLDEAEQRLNRAKALGESAELWNNMGGVALERRDYAAALDGFARALKLNPRLTHALINAGQAAARLGQQVDAERYFRRALELAPTDADAANQLGLLLARSGQTAEAQGLFERAIESQRNHAAAINNLAILFASTNRRSEAIAALTYGTEATPDHDLIWINLAKLYAEAGDRGRAASALERLLARRPENREAQLMLDRLRVP